jgi:hypothetical protein
MKSVERLRMKGKRILVIGGAGRKGRNEGIEVQKDENTSIKIISAIETHIALHGQVKMEQDS